MFSNRAQGLIFFFLGWLLLPSAQAIEAKPQFPGVDLRHLEESYYPFYEANKKLFAQALAGKPAAVDAFFDVKRGTDGEHSFTHALMSEILLVRVGDRAFSRHLASRAPLVQWRVANGLPLGVVPNLRERYPAYADLADRLHARYPRTTELVVHWQSATYKKVFRLDRQWPNHPLQRTAG